MFLTLELLQKANLDGYGFIHLFSGVDMPIRKNDEFDLFFDNTSFEGFFSFDSLTETLQCEKSRLGRYYLFDLFDHRNRTFIPLLANSILTIV